MAFISFNQLLKKELGTGLAKAGISTAGTIAGSLISGGNSTKLGQYTQLFGAAASQAIPGIGGAIAGAGLGVLGGIFNAAGTKRNEANIAKVKNNISELNNYLASASDFDSYVQLVANSPLAMYFKNSDLGRNGWFNHTIDNMSNDFRNQQSEGVNRVNRANFENGLNIGTTKVNNLLAGNFALGGSLNTHGGTFDNGVTYVNNGGTHEENPNNGVPISIGSLGKLNKVEEGEVLYNDYVFSNRLLVPGEIKYKLKLGNKNNMTYADAAKKLNKEAEERPNDPISKNGVNANLSVLAEALELQKQLEMLEQQEYMNKLRLLQGDSGEYIGYPTLGDNLYAKGGKTIKSDGKYFIVDDNSYDPSQPYEWVDLTKDIKENPVLLNLIKPLYLTPDERALYSMLDYDEIENQNISDEYYDYNHLRYLPLLEPRYITAKSIIDNLSNIRGNSAKLKKEAGKKDALAKTYIHDYRTSLDNVDLQPTWMRKAPIAASGIVSLTDALGLTNKPDLRDANSAINLYKNAGLFSPVGYNPIGNYVGYDPYDIDYAMTKANALSAAGLRNIMNTSGGNRGIALAGTLAANRNSEDAIGDIYKSAYQYNLSNRLLNAEYNKDTNKTNAQGFLTAATSNQNARLQSRSAYLQGMLGAYQLRQQARQVATAARSANLSNFVNSLGDLGRENFAWNLIKTNPGIYYSYNKDGGFTYDPTKNNNNNKTQG